MRPFFWLSFVLTVFAGQTIDDDNTTLIESLDRTDRHVRPLKLGKTAAREGPKDVGETTVEPTIRTCGNPTDTSTCHFEGTVDEPCEICDGVTCPHGRKCEKVPGACRHDCVCERAGEIPDEGGICRGACHPNPCHNNGVCYSKSHKFQCECTPGYDGERCEKVRNICLDPQPPLCPLGNYECTLKGVNTYSCECAKGYWKNQDNHCVRVSHMAKIEMHFTETPYSETFNDPHHDDYTRAREYIRAPFEIIYGNRLVSVEFHNFTQGSLVANLDLYLKAAENGSQWEDEFTFREHLLQCSMGPSSVTSECFGSLGRVFLPMNAWTMQDERCDNVACPEGTICEPVDGEAETTRCVCASGFEGYGSTVDTQGTIVELCRDVNECETSLNLCPDDETCVNRNGNFECTTPCQNVKCPGYAECIPSAHGGYECQCSWIYAGSACSFPWTLIFLVTTGLFILTTAAAIFLLFRTGTSFKSSSKGKYKVSAVSSRLTAVRPTLDSLQ